MDQVIKILTSLGIDSTFYLQFGIFFVAFISMKWIVFDPYLKAHNERLKRTVGGVEETESLLQATERKEEEYSQQAKRLNGQIREIFAHQNEKAKKEKEQIMAVAKKEADGLMKGARSDLQASVDQLRKEMETHIPSISQSIQKKFLGSQGL